MDTLTLYVREFEATYLNVAGTDEDPYKDVPEFDDYDFDQSPDAWDYDEYYA